MSDIGYIKLHRKMLQTWQFCHNSKIGWVWIWLLSLASYQDEVRDGVTLKRGQLLSSRSSLAKETGLSEQEVRTALVHLVRENQIFIEGENNRKRLITIVNYDKYQGDSDRKLNQVSNQDSNQVFNQVSNQVFNNVNNSDSNSCERISQNINQVSNQVFNQETNQVSNQHIKENKENNYKGELCNNSPSANADMKSKDAGTHTDVSVNVGERIDWDGLLNFFNDKMKDKAIPTISVMTDKRKQTVRARMKEYGKQSIAKAIINASNSAHMNGINNRGWVATFDWIFRPTNFPKVLEGNYNIERNGTSESDNKFTSRLEQQRIELEQRQGMCIDIIQRLAQQNKQVAPTPPDD